MNNDNGELVDLYIPRKWQVFSASNRIIHAKDHASVQISFVDVDENGLYKNSQTAYAICGALRRMGESDDCINRLAKRSGLLPKNF
ncbi:40S ribosomal protein S21 [Blomia tropicalis]|nr:40S ribosomal protein S21 [Blomia tropicalis]